MGFICTIGKTFNRRLSLGLLFINTASVADKNLTIPPKSTELTAKSCIPSRHTGGYNNHSSNPSFKDKSSFSFEQRTAYQEYVGIIKSDIKMKKVSEDVKILSIDDWLTQQETSHD